MIWWYVRQWYMDGTKTGHIVLAQTSNGAIQLVDTHKIKGKKQNKDKTKVLRRSAVPATPAMIRRREKGKGGNLHYVEEGVLKIGNLLEKPKKIKFKKVRRKR